MKNEKYGYKKSSFIKAHENRQNKNVTTFFLIGHLHTKVYARAVPTYLLDRNKYLIVFFAEKHFLLKLVIIA